MASFDEDIVREYFELNGFFVRHLLKHSVHSRKKTAQETVDLLVHNPSAPSDAPEPNFQSISAGRETLKNV